MKTINRIFLSIIILISFASQSFAQASCANIDLNADIVIMMDFTGSNSAQNIIDQKNALLDLLDTFSDPNAITTPWVGVGTFNSDCTYSNSQGLDCSGSTNEARIIPGGSMTDTFGALGGTPDLYDSVNNLTGPGLVGNGVGFTNLEAALMTAQAELNANGRADVPDYIIMISDGNPNLPGFDSDLTCGICDCPPAENAADAYATSIEPSTQIIAIHYDPNGAVGACTLEGGEAPGFLYMQNQIASNPGLFYDSTAGLDLTGVFNAIAGDLTCDDGDACTMDFCNTTTQPFMCGAAPDLTDTDMDGVPNCMDVCANGDDTLIGTACGANGAGVCQVSSAYVCENDELVCPDVTPGQAGEETCNGLDDDCDGEVDEGNVCCENIEAATLKTSIDGTALRLNALTRKASRRLKRCGGTAQVKNANAFIEEADKEYLVIWENSQIEIPNSLSINCTGSSATPLGCTLMDFSASINTLSVASQDLNETARRATRRLKNQCGQRRKAKKLNRRANKLLDTLREEIGAIPSSANSCG